MLNRATVVQFTCLVFTRKPWRFGSLLLCPKDVVSFSFIQIRQSSSITSPLFSFGGGGGRGRGQYFINFTTCSLHVQCVDAWALTGFTLVDFSCVLLSLKKKLNLLATLDFKEISLIKLEDSPIPLLEEIVYSRSCRQR